MENKICTQCNIEKHINNFYKDIQNAKTVTSNEVYNITMIIKIKYQSNKKYNLKKSRDKLLPKQNDYNKKRITD